MIYKKNICDFTICEHILNDFISGFFQMSVKARMDQLIKDYAVFVISKSTCPFCHTAKKVLGKYDIPAEKMKIIDIDGDKDCSEIQSYMQQITGGRTVPRVFIQGRLIILFHPVKEWS